MENDFNDLENYITLIVECIRWNIRIKFAESNLSN